MTVLPLAKSSAKFNIVRADTLATLPPPEWLVEGVLPKSGLALAFGDRGSGKSFGMLDLAASLSLGRPWHGHAAHAVPIVYVVAEGTWGFCPRVASWMNYYRTPELPNLFVALSPVQVHRPRELQAFAAEVRAVMPSVGLFIFDTLARCFVGGDEVNAIDMGLVVSGAASLQEDFGAAVIFTHHTSRHGDAERGHTSLPGACDTMLRFRSTSSRGTSFSISCAKQKDAAPFETLPFHLKAEGDSCVPILDDGLSALTPTALGVLQALATAAGEGKVRASVWQKAAEGARRSFFRHRSTLLDDGFVLQDAGEYSVSAKGRRALSSGSATVVPL